MDEIILHRSGKIFLWWRRRIWNICKSLHSRKSFVLGELSFARMPSRQYCLKVNKASSWKLTTRVSQLWPVIAMRCGDPTWNDPNFESPKIAPKAKCTMYMSKLDIFRNPKFWAIHVGSPHLMAVTGCNELILANNSKTEFVHFRTTTPRRHAGKRKFSQNKWFLRHFRTS